MPIQAIESLHFDVNPLPYQRLGVRFDPTRCGTPCVCVGKGNSAVKVCFALFDPKRPFTDPNRPGNLGITLRVVDIQSTIEPLVAAGITERVPRDIRFSWVQSETLAGTDLMLVEDPHPSLPGTPDFEPLKRLDHIAAVTHDLEEKCRFWEDVLGVPVTGEVVTPTMVIRQLKIGDAIFELLGPAGPDSPIHQRPAGLVSMAAWEVDDLPAAVTRARAAGFTVPDPAVGVLPGTRTATIPAAELGGIAMQLLQYC